MADVERRKGGGPGVRGRDGGPVERRKSMETKDDDVPVISHPAQVLYSFDSHSMSGNKSSAQLAIVLEPEQDSATSRGYREREGKRMQEAYNEYKISDRLQ